MRRITRLIEQDGVDPATILACTFTRTAAKDLERSVSELGVDGAERIQAQTVHGLCFSMLSSQDVLVATNRIPRPLMQFEERFLREDLKSEGRGSVRDCKKRLIAFSAAWARLQHEHPGWPDDPEDRAFHAVLVSWLKFHRAMLIGELIPEAVAYLRNNPQSPYRRMFDYVLVDEYQDLNRAEQELIELLASGELVVIGDEDQSIYSFKHAHPEGIVQFPETHNGTELEDLAECRRCPKTVVAMANALICNNASRSCRALNPRDENPDGEVHVIQWPNPEEEAKGIALYIACLILDEVVTAGDILVLAPRREFGYRIRDELRELDIPAHSFFSEEPLDGDPKDMQSSRAQQAITLLMQLADHKDIVALRCWCGFGSPSLNSQAWKRLRSYCEETGDTPWTALERLSAGEIRLPNSQSLIARFRELQQEIGRFEAFSVGEIIEDIFPEEEDWAGPFRTIFEETEIGDITLSQIVDVIRKNIIQPETPTDVDYVRIMSLHKSKGLTADLVVVAGCIEGLIPNIDENLPIAQQSLMLEEQRRLFYVAITRTRRKLVLSSITRLPLDIAFRMRARIGKKTRRDAYMYMSSFIREFGRACPQSIKGNDFLKLLEL